MSLKCNISLVCDYETTGEGYESADNPHITDLEFHFAEKHDHTLVFHRLAERIYQEQKGELKK